MFSDVLLQFLRDDCFLTTDIYLQTLNTGSLFYATLNAIAYFYMVSVHLVWPIFIVLFCLKDKLGKSTVVLGKSEALKSRPISYNKHSQRFVCYSCSAPYPCSLIFMFGKILFLSGLLLGRIHFYY